MDDVRNPIDLTLFVACYNEEDNIVPTLETLIDALRDIGVSYEVIVVDDASSDESVPRVRQYMQQHPALPVRLGVNERNRGPAHNCIAAARLGEGTYFRMICGDHVEPKETFTALFRRLGEADMLIPYYAYREGEPRTAFRIALSRVFAWLVRSIGGYRVRYYNAMAVHRRENVVRYGRAGPRMAFQADLITRLLDQGATYVEVPVTGRERETGKSTAVSFRNLAAAGWFLLELLLRRARKALRPAPDTE